ncbi:hypothetical protein ACFOWM_06175 [Ferruginibacter yonginensis]|uniref:Uncharacterized protein n=1 Tax=Ferruginibacter yonginensis TaxID=1310416 RepID=A0ABV8QSV5_9BACT
MNTQALNTNGFDKQQLFQELKKAIELLNVAFQQVAQAFKIMATQIHNRLNYLRKTAKLKRSKMKIKKMHSWYKLWLRQEKNYKRNHSLIRRICWFNKSTNLTHIHHNQDLPF